MNLIGLASCLVPVALVACTKSESSAPSQATNETPKTVVAVAPTPPAPAPVPTPTPPTPPTPPATEERTARIEWNAGGAAYAVTAVDVDKRRHVHLAAGSSTFDVAVTGGDEEWMRVTDGAVVYWSRTDVPNPMEVPLHGFFAARIAWDAKAGKPVVKKTWKCVEEQGPCVEPQWVGRQWVDPNAEDVDD